MGKVMDKNELIQIEIENVFSAHVRHFMECENTNDMHCLIAHIALKVIDNCLDKGYLTKDEDKEDV